MSHTEDRVEDEQLKRLINIRRGNRSAVTKLEREILALIDAQATISTDVTVRIDSISGSLKQKQQYLRELDEKILERISLELIEREIEESSDWETKLLELIHRIDKFKQGSYSQSTHTDATPNSISLHEQQHTRSPAYSETVQAGVRLPKIELPKFNGDITQFHAFWQSFECAVHLNESISEVHKLNYLISLLEGPAYRVVAGLNLTEGNYHHAVETLNSRFGNKQKIISAHMQSLLKLQDCPNDKVSQLRYIYDKINVHVRGLESLGMSQESYGSLLIPIIMQRMPSEITVQVARKVTEDIWPIKEILEIIRLEIEAREIGAMVIASDKKQPKPVANNNSRPPPGTTRTFLTSEGQSRIQCYFCQNNHLSINCKEITDISKRTDLLQKAKRCFKCLKKGHIAKNCDKKCRKCGAGHHQVICKRDSEEPEEKEGETDRLVAATVKGKEQVLLQTARAHAFGDDYTKRVPIHILFDSGSQRSYVSEDLKKKLALNVEKAETLNINTFGSEKYEKRKCDLVKLNIDVDNQAIPVKAFSYPKICSPLSPCIDIDDYPHLQGLKLADSVDLQAKRVDLLVGADHFYDFVIGKVIKGSSGPVAVSSKLGWLLSGPYKSYTEHTNCNTVNSNLILNGSPQEFFISDHEISDGKRSTDETQEINDSLKEFWRHESLGITDFEEESKGGSLPEEFNIRFNGTRYEVSLPWRNNFSSETLPDNYDLCVKRLKSLRNRLKGDSDFLVEYNSIFQEQLEKGIIERVPEDEMARSQAHYLCHHAVIRKDHDTTKVRVVFDASAKSGPDKLSLNDHLQLGDNHMPSLFDTLLRFRCHPLALTADIEKAFLQIEITQNDRDYLRFLWLDDITKENPSVIPFRWCRLAFGLKSSPSILGATIKQHLSLFKDEYPETVKVLDRLYADDLSCGAETTEQALQIYHQSKDILLKGGFNLRKWKSNDKELTKQINALEQKVIEDSCSQSCKLSEGQSNTKQDLSSTTADCKTKVLGLNWNNDSDHIFFDLSQLAEFANSLPPTKRSLLKIAAKVFDPLGCLSLFTINLKVLFQELCVAKLDWDEELSGKRRDQYQVLISELNILRNIKLARSLFKRDKTVSKVEIHAFSDASERAYASVVYLRVVYETGEVAIHFVASKAKVSPLKQQSIPRLELLGANLMAKLVNSIRSALQLELPNRSFETFYWIDSTAALCWIKNDKPWKQFIRNRVADILQFSQREEWNYCPGSKNPADLPSRGKYGPTLSTNLFWWEGPEFLKFQPSEWPSNNSQIELESKEAMAERVKYETKYTHVMVNSGVEEITPSLFNLIETSRFSSKGKLLRTLGWVLRFVENLKCAISKKPLSKEDHISVAEGESAETKLITSIQNSAFKSEINFLTNRDKSVKPPIHVTQFNLILDNQGVLRCRSRVNKASVVDSGKQPILLPQGHQYTSLLIEECHQRAFHNGTRETLNLLRQRYWVPRGREMVKKQIRKCFICKKLEGLPFKTKFCPDLPHSRVSDCPPFSQTGIDFAGPLLLSGKEESTKYYICLFTCMATRAIHLELVESLDVKSFIQAFRRFSARRGLPAKLLSDNAKTFKSAAKEIRQLIRSPRLTETLSLLNVKWQFITERSPWQGGAWERLIRSVKRCVIKVIGRTMLSYNEMCTVLTEIESIINSRPLTYVHDDSEGISYPLTPSHLINGRNLNHLPHDHYYEVISTYESLSKRAKYNRLLLGQFTKRWKNEYLLGLLEAYKPKDSTKEPVVAVGDVVILKDEQVKRSFWKLGRITELIPGSDGSIRSAKVQVASQEGKKVLGRPLKLLIPLEIPSNYSFESAPAMPGLAQPAQPAPAQHTPTPSTSLPVTKSKRSAAVIGEFNRRDKLT